MIGRWATFDCYGTLIDWERGIVDALTSLWPDADGRKLLARYHEIEPQVQTEGGMPYRDVLRAVLERLATAEGLQLPDDQRDLLATSLPEWPPFHEVPAELEQLRARGWRIAILSNCDADLLDASMKRIGIEPDLTISVEKTGSYKPAHGHWDVFFGSSDADPAGHVHVAASLFHDIAPCADMGLRVVWIDRNDEETDLPTAATLPDLRGLADTLDGLVRA